MGSTLSASNPGERRRMSNGPERPSAWTRHASWSDLWAAWYGRRDSERSSPPHSTCAASDPRWSFVVVGPQDDAKGDALDAADIAEAEAIGNVVFTGHRDDVEDLYPAFDLFVLPSYREGFPRSAMEAAASGVPVIATDIRGCRQAVDHGVTGMLVPLHDVNALVVAIADLATHASTRLAMGARARSKAEAEFDDQAVIQTTLEAYRRLPLATRS